MIITLSLEEQVREKLKQVEITEEQFLEYLKFPRMEDVPAATLQYWIGSLDIYLRRLALKAEEQAGQFP